MIGISGRMGSKQWEKGAGSRGGRASERVEEGVAEGEWGSGGELGSERRVV